MFAVADPGFPVGDADLIGGANSQSSYVSKNLYVKIKESGPLGGHIPPGSANGLYHCIQWETVEQVKVYLSILCLVELTPYIFLWMFDCVWLYQNKIIFDFIL